MCHPHNLLIIHYELNIWWIWYNWHFMNAYFRIQDDYNFCLFVCIENRWGYYGYTRTEQRCVWYMRMYIELGALSECVLACCNALEQCRVYDVHETYESYDLQVYIHLPIRVIPILTYINPFIIFRIETIKQYICEQTMFFFHSTCLLGEKLCRILGRECIMSCKQNNTCGLYCLPVFRRLHDVVQ